MDASPSQVSLTTFASNHEITLYMHVHVQVKTERYSTVNVKYFVDQRAKKVLVVSSPILAGISGFFWIFSLHTNHILSKRMRYWGARWTKTFKWEVPPPLSTFLPCLVPQAFMRLACFQIQEMAATLASEFYSSLSCWAHW